MTRYSASPRAVMIAAPRTVDTGAGMCKVPPLQDQAHAQGNQPQRPGDIGDRHDRPGD
jgi:hypothetical protein